MGAYREFVFVLSFYRYGHENIRVFADETTARRSLRTAFIRRAEMLGGSAAFSVEPSRPGDSSWWFRGPSHTAILERIAVE